MQDLNFIPRQEVPKAPWAFVLVLSGDGRELADIQRAEKLTLSAFVRKDYRTGDTTRISKTHRRKSHLSAAPPHEPQRGVA